jgi:hypothetical protein
VLSKPFFSFLRTDDKYFLVLNPYLKSKFTKLISRPYNLIIYLF